MKSTASLLASALALGAVAGVALGYWEARPWTAGASTAAVRTTAASTSAGNSTADKGPTAISPTQLAKGPTAVIPELVYAFGNMEMNTKKEHTFPIKNAGDKPLTVTFVTHTCKCTKVELAGKEVEPNDSIDVPPGGETQVHLEWAAKVAPGPFRHGATFSTSDPAQPRVEFTVDGEIVATDTVSPSQFAFGAVRAGEKAHAEVFVLSFIDEKLQVDSAEVVEPDLAERLTVHVEPATKDQLPDKTALAGARVVAEYDAGGVIGPFGGSIRVKTNIAKSPELEIPVYGSVTGDLSVYGRGWSSQLGLLRMDPMTSATGGKAKLNVTMRGEHAADTKLAIKSVKPDELKVALGERKALGDRLAQQAITFEIPPGTKPLVLAGENLGGEGEIVLTTGHPVTPELKIRVQLTVSP